MVKLHFIFAMHHTKSQCSQVNVQYNNTDEHTNSLQSC